MSLRDDEEGHGLLANGEGHTAEKFGQGQRFTGGRWRILASSVWSRVAQFRPSTRTLHNTGRVLTPSYLQARLFPEPQDANPPPERVFKTAYLDGLRGVASLFVFIFHCSTMMYRGTLYGYGQGNQGKNNYFFQLPIIRLITDGSFMVSIFFVISGFALSLAPLKHMRSNDPDQGALLRSLSSAVFRRPIRLFLPPLFSTILPFVFMRLGLYEATRPIAAQPGFITGPPFMVLNRHASFGQEFWDWLTQFWSLVQVCHDNSIETFEPADRYNAATWTIPVEFGASLFLYLTHLGTSQLRPGIRIGLMTSLIVLAFASKMWVMTLFWGGFLIAELDAVVNARDAMGLSTPSSRGWRIFFWLNFICGMFVGGYPYAGANTTPGYIWLSMMIPTGWTPRHRFWEVIGALQMMLSISRLTPLISLLSRPTIRYLGHISYPLYLVHWPIIQTFGIFIFSAVYNVTGKTGDVDTFVGWCISFFFISVITFWTADLFWRVVDTPGIRFGKWLEGVCTRQR